MSDTKPAVTEPAAAPDAPPPGMDWTDPDQIAAHLAQQQQQAPASASAEPAAAAEPAKAPQAEPAPATEPARPDGILARDGKHMLPYSVLEEERANRRKAEAQAAEVGKQLAEISKALDEAEKGGTPELTDLSALEADYPAELINPLKAMQAQLAKVVDSNQALAAQLAQQVQDKEAQAQDSFQEGYLKDLAQFPLLAKAQQNGGPMFEEGVKISERLVKDENHKPQSRIDHLKEVDAQLRDLYGLPPAPTPEQTPAQIAARPLPPKVPKAPGSLSDIQGGVPPAASEAEAFVSMDNLRGAALLAKMTPAQQDEYLSRNWGGRSG